MDHKQLLTKQTYNLTILFSFSFRKSIQKIDSVCATLKSNYYYKSNHQEWQNKLQALDSHSMEIIMNLIKMLTETLVLN